MDSTQIEVKLTPGVKYFTISEIIKEAARIFCFKDPTTKGCETLYDTIEHRIRRRLKGKKLYGETKRNKKYSRSDVQHLLQIDLYDFFIETSKKQNEKDYDSHMLKGEWLGHLERIADSEQARETAVGRYIQKYKKGLADQLDYLIRERDGALTEEDKELFTKIRIEETRLDIFFEVLYQYFFDSLIAFDETRYREDLKYELIDDDLPGKNDVDAAEATNRLKDNRNYYELKKSSVEIKNFLDKFNAGERPE